MIQPTAPRRLIPLRGPRSGHLKGELDPVRCVLIFKRTVRGRVVVEEVPIGDYVQPRHLEPSTDHKD